MQITIKITRSTDELQSEVTFDLRDARKLTEEEVEAVRSISNMITDSMPTLPRIKSDLPSNTKA
jgi:hypothetical protein